MQPHTIWKGTLQAFRELQEAGINLEIESFGPFGRPTHGHPSSYNLDTIFICYRVGLGNDYTTVPTSHPVVQHAGSLAANFYCLAHKSGLASSSLFLDGVRIDQRWDDAQRRMLAVYHAALPRMHRRYLQKDGQAVIWHDAAGAQATLWNFTDRLVALPGQVQDLTTDAVLPPAATYALQANHVYAITGTALPTRVSTV